MRAPGETAAIAAEIRPQRVRITPESFLHIYLGLAVGLCAGLVAVFWRRIGRVDPSLKKGDDGWPNRR